MLQKCSGTARGGPFGGYCGSPRSYDGSYEGMCSQGITHIWMQPGSESAAAIAEAAKAGITVISGECILMFLEPVESFHAFHRFVKVVGRYPK